MCLCYSWLDTRWIQTLNTLHKSLRSTMLHLISSQDCTLSSCTHGVGLHAPPSHLQRDKCEKLESRLITSTMVLFLGQSYFPWPVSQKYQ